MTLFEPKTPKNQGLQRLAQQNERGSVIVWILVMVALFGALSYTVSQGSRGGASDLTQKQAELAATSILDHASQVKNAVRQLQINGCSDTEISFDQAFVSGYSNPNSPSDESCHVYSTYGGGLRYQNPNIEWLDTSKSSEPHYNTWFANGGMWVNGLGTDGSGSSCLTSAQDCRELIIGVPFIKKEICMAINKALSWGVDNTGTAYQDNGNSFAANNTPFVGSYINEANMGSASPSDYSNIFNGCIEGDTNPSSETYSFFQVLIAR